MRIAINGFGRIGRSVFRILEANKEIEVVAINDLFDRDALRYLLSYDTVMGPFGKKLMLEGDYFVTDKGRVKLLGERNPADNKKLLAEIARRTGGTSKLHASGGAAR